MIIVDTHSKWLEVVPMSTTTTEKTLDVLCSMLAIDMVYQNLLPTVQLIQFPYHRLLTNNIRHTCQHISQL